MKLIDKIALIYIKDKKILCTLSKGKDTYYLPGGKREKDEADIDTLLRECKEELDVEVKKETVKYYGTFEAQAHAKEEGIIVKMTCYRADFNGNITPSSEIESINWLNSNDLNKISQVDKLIFNDLKKNNLIG
mgnify:CR=1 FL=1